MLKSKLLLITLGLAWSFILVFLWLFSGFNTSQSVVLADGYTVSLDHLPMNCTIQTTADTVDDVDMSEVAFGTCTNANCDGSLPYLLYSTFYCDRGRSDGICAAYGDLLNSTLYPSSNVALTNAIDWRDVGLILTATYNCSSTACVELDDGDYHIAANASAVRDAGVYVGVECDMGDQPRPMGYNIGADESFYSGLNICLQNPAKCPLNQAMWPGEPDAWQRTGRKWRRHSGTPAGAEVIWEWSAPYAAPTPEYMGYRENYYEDFSNTPDTYPVAPGPEPVSFAWALWEPKGDDYILRKYGGPAEEDTGIVGYPDCESGLYYPIVSQDLRYTYTPMSVVRDGECVDGGYIATYRADLWGPPLSPSRVGMCNHPVMGIPADQSLKGNLVCKVSPYVGVVYQRYVFGPGPTPADKSVGGCEAVIYAWGGTEPQYATSGQDYQSWFRNGELRFSRWLNLSDQISDDIPAPDDHAWWDAQCERAWTEMPNWLYTGNYKIGFTVYTDTIGWPLTAVATIPIGGGNLTSTLDSIMHTFAPHTFTDTVIVTHTIRFQNEFTSTNGLIGINRFYDLTATYSRTGNLAEPQRSYTVTIRYTDTDVGPAIEETLALYSRSGGHWVKDPSSTLITSTLVISGTNVIYIDKNTIVAMPDHFSTWAVLGKTHRVFLPLVVKKLSFSPER
jgi:hypothetical protein